MGAPLSSWPWDKLGCHKYVLYGPFFAKAVSSTSWDSLSPSWWFHLLVLCALRGFVYTAWCSFGNMLFLTRSRRIVKEGVDFKQIDAEWDWDNFLILQAFIAAGAYYLFPSLDKLPVWNAKGLIYALLLHLIFSETLFYLSHRLLHSPFFFRRYHALHHSIRVPQSFTAAFATPLEHLILSLIMGIPLVGILLSGHASIALIYSYVLCFDFLRSMLHSNVEILPYWLFHGLPFLRYLVASPTYHSIHHKDKNSNFCLFMPIFDLIGGTLNPKSWEEHRKSCQVSKDNVPEFVFLTHAVDIISSTHAPYYLRTYGSLPFVTRLILLPLWPIGLLSMPLTWAFSKTFLLVFYHLHGHLFQTWVIPRAGLQYFLPFAKEGINREIERAILTADKIGVKVLNLAALNKNEALNGGGTLFVEKHPNLRVRITHGNTLTAAVILQEINKDVREVFLTGATSKLGRAIALYLCRKGIRVLMLTRSAERFNMVQKEAPPECQHLLSQVTKYEAAETCKTWIVGKGMSEREQNLAPSGTYFHQFAVPPIAEYRKDCLYGKPAAMRVPNDIQGLGHCEYTLDRGVIHACHVGGAVHFLEGWTHHEVGPIDVDQIDVVWAAALRYGFLPV